MLDLTAGKKPPPPPPPVRPPPPPPPPPPTCTIPNIAHGTASAACSGVEVAGSCSYTCNAGSSGDGTVDCQASLVFSAGTCTAEQCSAKTIQNTGEGSTTCTGATGATSPPWYEKVRFRMMFSNLSFLRHLIGGAAAIPTHQRSLAADENSPSYTENRTPHRRGRLLRELATPVPRGAKNQLHSALAADLDAQNPAGLAPSKPLALEICRAARGGWAQSSGG